MLAVDAATEWLERDAAPAIRRGISSVARHGLAVEAFDRWEEPWQEAFQNAAIAILRSPTVQRLVGEARWEELRAYAARAGANAAHDQLRLQAGAAHRFVPQPAEDGAEPAPLDGIAQPSAEEPEQQILARERERERRALLERVWAVLQELPDTPSHPQRRILGYYLHLLDQELVAPESDRLGAQAAPDSAAEAWAGWVRELLGNSPAPPALDERRYDIWIAHILRPMQMMGEAATDSTRKQAAQWVRTELSRARRTLRSCYERRFGALRTW